MSRRTIWPLRLALAAAVALALFPARAGAEGERPQEVKDACIRAYESSQVSRQQGHDLDAREALRSCAREECPALVRTDCATWLADLEEALPSIVVQARAGGVERNDVTVFVDGKEVKTGLDGKAISVDPGPHALRYVTAGFPPLEASVVLREGEHFRPLVAEFRSPELPVARPIATVRPVPLPVWILAGVSLVATGSFVGWAISGNARRDALERQCAPFCAESDVAGVQRQYLAADLSLAAAAASLGVASLLYFTRARVPVSVGVSGGPPGFVLRVSGDL